MHPDPPDAALGEQQGQRVPGDLAPADLARRPVLPRQQNSQERLAARTDEEREALVVDKDMDIVGMENVILKRGQAQVLFLQRLCAMENVMRDIMKAHG